MNKPKFFKINESIKYPNVRLINNSDGNEVVQTSIAIDKANKLNKDLILINEKASPPIVIIEDYKKYLYNLKKKERDQKKLTKNKTTQKELKLSSEISDNDLNTKYRKAEEFLKRGDRVKCTIQLKGRQKATPERGELVMVKFASSLEEIGIPESLPKLQGGRWTMILKPKIKN